MRLGDTMVFGLNNEGEKLRIVEIRTRMFNADAVFIGDMPSTEVLKLYIQQSDTDRVLRLYRLIRKALVDPAKVEEFANLSFDQLALVVDAYATARPKEIDWNDIEGNLLSQ